jgi:hypothetical protein
MLLWLGLLSFAVAIPGPRPENSDSNKKIITLHISVSAEGVDKLPSGSMVELRGIEQAARCDVQKSPGATPEHPIRRGNFFEYSKVQGQTAVFCYRL